MFIPHQPEPINAVRYFFPDFDWARMNGAAEAPANAAVPSEVPRNRLRLKRSVIKKGISFGEKMACLRGKRDIRNSDDEAGKFACQVFCDAKLPHLP
jgi:hypothetical protein